MMRKTKEMMEAVTKDPEAALEKYGKSTLEQAKKATEGTVAGSPEENEENDVDKKPTNILEKVTIGILGTGAFMSLKKRLP